MRLFSPRNYKIWIVFFSLAVFSPGVYNFFLSDDWFHLRISNIQNLHQFLNFFSFGQTSQSAAFYRPIPTQIFFFILQKIFGLNQIFYHVFVYIIFSLSLWLVLRVSESLVNKKAAIYSMFFYAFSVTNFTRLYFLSAFQEIAMFTLLMLSTLFILKSSMKDYVLSVIFFILALGCKETAVVFPVILLLIFLNKREKYFKLIPFILILSGYLFLYFSNIGLKSEGSYTWNFSILRAINTFSWYIFWSIGVPEFFVDYVSSGFKIIPKFYKDFPQLSHILLVLIKISFLSIVVIALKNWKLFTNWKIYLGLSIFLISIFPVLFLPLHKFSLELTLPLFGFCLFLGLLVSSEKNKQLRLLVLFTYILLNIFSNYLTFVTNYTVSRAKLSEKIYSQFKSDYPTYPKGFYFEFKNVVKSSQDWGVSRQIAQTTSYSDMFRVIYNDNSINVYFEDIPGERPKDLKPIYLNSLDYLKTD